MIKHSKLAGYFVTKERDNGEAFVTLADNRPQWLYDSVYSAHNGSMPCDWVYATCKDVAYAIDSGDLKDSDDCATFADGNVDIYTKDLYQWGAHHCLQDFYTAAESDAKDNCMLTGTIEEQLRAIQYIAIRYIADIMLQHKEESEA